MSRVHILQKNTIYIIGEEGYMMMWKIPCYNMFNPPLPLHGGGRRRVESSCFKTAIAEHFL